MKLKRSDFDYFLDITEDVCPMTFVKVRLQIEKMSAKETLEVRLKGTEPLKNVSGGNILFRYHFSCKKIKSFFLLASLAESCPYFDGS